MKNIFSLIFTFIVLCIAYLTLISAGSEQTFDLKTSASITQGTANVRFSSLNGLWKLELNFKAENIQITKGKIYEVWLIDEDSGYELSLGSFNPTKAGKVSYKAIRYMVNPMIYDKLVVSQEPINDIRPSLKTIILLGIIPNSIGKNLEFDALFDGKQVVPKTNSKAKGKATFLIDTSANRIDYSISFSGLEGQQTATQMHAFAPRGEGVQNIWFNIALGSPVSGSVFYGEGAEESIIAGLMYLDIKSTKFPNGEIRGQMEMK